MKTLLQLNNIHKAYGPRVILDDVSAVFTDEQKIGVIGRNGAGKSTLCKIITGHEEADSGTVTKGAELRLSYLEQHDPYSLDETVMQFLTRYTGKESWQCAKVAARFQMKGDRQGAGPCLLDSAIGALSGGYRTRVKLTSMLLSEPNFLILDEPTNYLDLKTLILLENFLQDYDGGFLIVSHDREFLRKTCEQTMEIETSGATLYPGTIDEYLVFKEDQKEQALAFNRNVEAKQKQLQLFVDRFKAKASKATQARSKMKQIGKLKTIEIAHALSNVRIKIPNVEKKKGIALRCENLSIGYPDKLVASKIQIEVPQGARVAILGDNGQGKTTFMRTIAGDLATREGSFRWGHGLKTAYYAQHVFATLDPDKDVYTHMMRIAAPEVTRQDILDLAGSFLFKGEDVNKKGAVLSGGERARLLLAGLLLTKSSVLLFDEPTNHLDFETVEALGDALKRFGGTIFFISHDRTFVNLVATEIIEVNNGAVIRYPGNYEDYVYSLENSVRQGLSADEPVKPPMAAKSDRASYQARKAFEAEKRRVTSQIKKSEERMAAYKNEKQLIEDRLTRSDAVGDESLRYQELLRLIDEEERGWIGLSEELESISSPEENIAS